MDIHLDLYRIFREVARCGSISRAAERLFVSQSAVSQAIMQLENQIGGRLFDRGVRGVTLTTEGGALFSHIDDALELIENAQAKFAEMKALGAGSIRIGASDTICSLFLLPILKRFNDLFPEIRISVANRTTRESIELLKHAAVDIAFVNLPVENDASLEVTPLKAIHDCFVAGGKYAALADETMHLGDLMRWGESARRRAVSDELTGLYNRRFLEESARERFSNASFGLRNLSLMMMDLDKIHEINQNHGTRAGDLVFIAMAEVLRSATRAGDICARLSGDEFAVLLPDAAPDEAILIAEKARLNIASRKVAVPKVPDSKEETEISVRSSIGIATAPIHADTWEKLCHSADEALRHAKELGRNRVEIARQ